MGSRGPKKGAKYTKRSAPTQRSTRNNVDPRQTTLCASAGFTRRTAGIIHDSSYAPLEPPEPPESSDSSDHSDHSDHSGISVHYVSSSSSDTESDAMSPGPADLYVFLYTD